MTNKERFESKFVVSSKCWTWTGSRDQNGYGQFRLNGKLQRAHRISYLWNVGQIPDGLGVLHRCDNPSCVRPDHLFVGTQTDNMRDASIKGRCKKKTDSMIGTLNQNAKLTPEKIVTIRLKTLAGASRLTLAKEFGVSAQTIQKIVSGRTWRHVQ
jgi:hypothetical protein